MAELIADGKSDREILDEFTSRYGARVLSEPEGVRPRWLYLMPSVAFALGISWAARVSGTASQAHPKCGSSQWRCTG